MERSARIIFLISALTSVVAVALICIFLFANGLPAVFKIGAGKFLFGTEWSPQDIPPLFGILPMILGSIYVTVGAIIVGVPVGILTSVFMAKFCPKSIEKVLKPALSLLAGIPSVVYGFFGMVVLVPLVKSLFGKTFGGNGNSIFTASILLGIMILPTIIEISTSAIKAVPSSYYEGALALGATHEKAVFFVTLPAAASGIMAAITLGIGRAIGETMAVVMVCGNQAVIRLPHQMFKGVRTLTANIITEMGYSEGLHREALIATGVVLFIFILMINLTFSLLKRRAQH